MKKKKYNYEMAKSLKNAINNYHNLVVLPSKDDIKFIKSNVINGVDFNKFNYKLMNEKINLKSDNLIKGRKIKDVLVKTHKIRLLPNEKQKDLLLKWMDAWIDMYNEVLSIIKKERKKQSQEQKKSLKYNEINLENLKLNKLKKDLQEYKKSLVEKTKIDSHILDYCINDVLAMLKSSITNLNKKNFSTSRLRYIKKSKDTKIFKIENNGGTITQNSFCTSKLGKLLKSNPKINYKRETSSINTIQYVNGKFYMLYKKHLINNKIQNEEQKILSLDPGHRTFMTGLSNNHLIEIGNNIDKKIKKDIEKMDRIKNFKDKKKIKNKRKHLKKREKKLKNYINNMHWQVINYITKNYNHILLGNYSTKRMVENNKTNSINKRIGSSLRFYQFREKLIYKCILNNCKYSLINEFNTTKSCSNCSTINNIGTSKEYICKKCKKEFPRDVNSSKNILLKGIVE
jgi:transposase